MNVFLWNARARNGHVEATLNHPFPAQVPVLLEVQFDPVPKPGLFFPDVLDALLRGDDSNCAPLFATTTTTTESPS